MTPRRILLLVGGLIAFVAVYLVYARFFGWLDGLPQLPASMLVQSDGTCRPPVRLTSPTIELLKVAFGETSPETEPAHYPTQLRFLQGDSLLVLAAGSPPSNPNSNRITLSPFSLAVFGKPRAEHLRRPGEVTEVNTVHADKAVLEFDRVVQSVAEIGGAKLVRLELISDPEQAPPDPSRREGKVHVTNNQRSPDPARKLLLRTVGPMFYRDQRAAPGGPPPSGPDIWTDAAVEIVDRDNLPRPKKAPPGQTSAAAGKAADVRNPAAVADVLAGRSLPPPTVSAVGMRVYLDHSKPANAPPPKEPRSGVGSFRRVAFLEKVVLNLWVEAGQGLIESGGPTESSRRPAAAAVAGGLVPAARDAAGLARDLLQVETRGPFVYDSEKHIARFDVLPLADPNLPNDVQVTKVSTHSAGQTLFSQVLEIEFSDPAADPNGPPRPAPVSSGARYKRLHAWTYTPGRFLTVGSDADQLEAYGQDLDHDPASGRTRLTGGPLYAVQKRNVLTAGGPKEPAILLIEPAPGNGSSRARQATVLGRGRVELYDPAAKAASVAASWKTSMVQSRESADGRDLDLYTLTDGAKFEDVRSDFWLRGKILKLWLAPQAADTPDAAPVKGEPTRARPHRLQAVGDVSGHSADLDIDHSEHLNTLFRDAPMDEVAAAPAAEPAPAKPPMDASDPGPRPAPPAPAAPQPKAPENPKPPMKLRARTIDTWVVRQPVPKPTPAPADQPAGAAVKYQLEKARCEGMVSAHQDPADATKPRGTDILGSLMLIDSEPEGSVLTVRGWDDRPGEVHNEGTSLIGPVVVIDQLHNRAEVRGRGSLVMQSATDFSGNTLKQAEAVVVHFRDGMTFHGAKKVADFFGKVNAVQGGSWVTCHTMQVNFDRPVYFTRDNRPDKPKAGPNDKPKIDVVSCYPAPADTADGPLELQVVFTQVDRDPATGKPVGRQQVVARELQVRAQARDPDGGEPYKHFQAAGPGVVRMWQSGAKDDDGTGPRPPAQADAPAQPPQTEMKLTIVKFSGRMNGREKGANFREATFLDPVEVTQVPTDNPDLDVERHKLPPKAVLLTCSDKFVVWSHRRGNEPAEQHMEATGNAYLRNDQYDGWGDMVRNDGKKVTFFGMDSVPARIKNRVGGNDQTGKKITYDRATNRYEVEGSIGGTLVSPPQQKK